MAFEAQRTLSRPEAPFAQKEPDVQNDPGFIRFQQTHFAPGGESYPEYLVWWWLTHKAGAVEYEDFQMYVVIGPFIPDVIISPPITDRRMWLEVYGVAFHTAPVRRGPESLAMDIMRREFALANDFEFIRVSDEDLVSRLDYTMSNAVAGREIRQFAA